MKLWCPPRRLGFNYIYMNEEKINLIEKLEEFSDNIYPFLEIEDIGYLIEFKIQYIIEVEKIDEKELKEITNSLFYYFLSKYMKLDKFIKFYELDINKLKKNSKKYIKLLKKDYKYIEKIEFNEENFIIRIKETKVKIEGWRNGLKNKKRKKIKIHTLEKPLVLKNHELREIQNKMLKSFLKSENDLHQNIYKLRKVTNYLLLFLRDYNFKMNRWKKLIYSLDYYFLKEYLNIKSLKNLSNMTEKEFKNYSKKYLNIMDKKYKKITNENIILSKNQLERIKSIKKGYRRY